MAAAALGTQHYGSFYLRMGAVGELAVHVSVSAILMANHNHFMALLMVVAARKLLPFCASKWQFTKNSKCSFAFIPLGSSEHAELLISS